MLSIRSSGNTRKTESFLDTILKDNLLSGMDRAAQRGVDALSRATPIESGLTADSWSYEIETKGDVTTIWWTNTHVVNGFNVAVGLQYGHATGGGGWVEGQDFINPALKSIFEEIADDVWEEVRRA